jgi:ferrous iron transport protein A
MSLTLALTLQTAPLHQPLLVQGVQPCTSEPEQQRQLEELGFLAGESVLILSQSAWGADRMVVRVGSSTFALRASEASHILVEAAS